MKEHCRIQHILKQVHCPQTATEQIIELRYKLHMIGIPLEELVHIFCDDEAVYCNTSDPISTYHSVRDSLLHLKKILSIKKMMKQTLVTY